MGHSDIFRSWFWYVSVAFFFFLFEISLFMLLLLLSLLSPNNFFFKFSHLIYVCWVSYSYYGNGSVTGGNLENNRLQRVLLFPLELSKPAKVVQAATKKIRRKKRRRSTKHGPNLESCLSRTPKKLGMGLVIFVSLFPFQML